ncbi:glycosyltransferase family 32 protein [Aspergillus clavatus NRRL 1]|uniref:Alpha-1,6-mannosyltransferase subunit (Och1), putative n=1 Tax=Aspergillus clavatus (strain ATCC 1007 / CBS 513.65 / DSM 816 / NCTC 3887 / NRRL 1 / QM 1276 / 107) TaxID=344612 RepID=A1CAJ9_ASPCL|nr:alpha-1,6-mannosyltransferase subunit (Och1), putative [Aspergillus clavatus NRRL 1]EAW12767.1 alpha-1,6-mannosyltransferase subunit (Och1), putative [Aspergillus clavatus NRRL 1]
MLTFRKSLIAAVILITFIVLLRSAHSGPSTHSIVPKPDEAVFDVNQAVSNEHSTEQKKEAQQAPLKPPPTAPLRDRLRYQFPYDLENKFPAYIWQTWKYTPSSVWFGEDLRPAEASWTTLHPGFVHEVVTDETQRHLIKYLYGSLPEVFEAYDSMPLPVLKADFFRYLILLARGGIYSDIDTFALKPASDWLPSELDLSKIGFVVGIEADPDRPDWHDWYSRRIQFCQWTIQAKAGHPILSDIVAYITEEALRMKKAGVLKEGKMDKTIVEFTGPAAWTDAVFRYFNDPEFFSIEPDSTHNVTYEDFTNQQGFRMVGDVVVLPITSFSPGVNQMGAGDYDDPMAFVKHDFSGSWKTDPSL